MIEIDPGPHDGTAGLARAYLEKGEYAKSVKYFEQYLKAYPDNQYMKRSLENARRGLAESKKQ